MMPYITAYTLVVQLLRVVIRASRSSTTRARRGSRLTRARCTIGLATLNATTVVSLGPLPEACWATAPSHGDPRQLHHGHRRRDHHHDGRRRDHVAGGAHHEHGVGNGMSLLVFTSIAATFPAALGGILKSAAGECSWASARSASW
ncbi:hypothetical protein QJS66_20485 [Kocuria rhizophila]|nr:hypothetical protein QJS66_20485 [Kocuria rhizophila]